MAFTKVRGPGIHTLSDITNRNINSSGIITASSFVGPLTASSGSSGTFDSLTVTGAVSIGGTLTYEDVKNIDSVGIITARSNIDAQADVLVGAGVSAVGIVTASSFVGGLPITSGANNRVITASSASAIQGEANLTFDGGLITGTHTSGNVGLELHATGNSIGNQTKYHNDHGEAYVGQAGDTTGNLLVHNTSNTCLLYTSDAADE